jgi:hypothetical protein
MLLIIINPKIKPPIPEKSNRDERYSPAVPPRLTRFADKSRPSSFG